MRSRASIALLLALACLLGCGLPYTPLSSTPSLPSGNWTNWQIQAGATITSPPNTYPSFLGAIQIQGTQASAIFTTVEATGSGTPLDYTGGYSTPTGSIGLMTQEFEFGITEPATPYTLTQIGIIGGCVSPPTDTGAECGAIFGVPSVAVQIAPINGTYTGTLTVPCPPYTSSCPASSGTGSLTLIQSTTPRPDGSFFLNGTLTFPPSSGFGTYPVSGIISGEGITLYDPTPGVTPLVSLAASTNPAGTQVTISNLAYSSGGTVILATFTGTLTHQ
jgi:hypothetical protein